MSNLSGFKMRARIRTKIIAVCALILSSSLLASSWVTYSYVKDIMREQAVRDNTTKLEQTSSFINRMQEQLRETAEYIISDSEVNALMVKDPNDTYEQSYFKKNKVREKLKLFPVMNSSLLNVMIIRPDGEVFSNYQGYDSYYKDYLNQAWFVDYRMGRSESRFSDPHDFIFLNRRQQVISYVVNYRNFKDDGDERYYLVLDFNQKDLASLFEQSNKDFERLLLLNQDGVPLFDSNPGETRWTDTDSEGGKYIEIVDDSVEEDWRQVAVISKSRLYERVNKLLLFYTLIVAVSLIVVMMILLPLLVQLTRPISKLVRAMKRVSAGDLNIELQIRSGDEMELLGLGFNRMMKDLKSLIESLVQEQKEKRNMQIQLLLSQMNPHFIYNTLNTVIYLAHAGRTKEVADMTASLIHLLQNTIKIGDDAWFTTLEDEIELVNKYAAIQDCRYPGRFRIEWDIQEELLPCMVLRMMLQPLIENALYHGIFPSERQGWIGISARRSDRFIEVSVRDNGIGISTSQTVPPIQNASTGIGLTNIRERLNFHYGVQAGLEIKSFPGEGTEVRIRLPLTIEDGDSTAEDSRFMRKITGL
ncbi:sensor histidine kinase [Paenibacillus sp. p3-SID1389]|uniref:sensor histidine kinase n=1 Tax=Paenibacillus sp. p3-SID1389 TaxID=2916364 RepID=UPI0021A8713B|nr:sensor histidine kinase [Paenibacillus sp. p3-SID1389]MCT2195142.1 sensor histidine kinase [Paenibacillus sp. p3-SID1389]